MVAAEVQVQSLAQRTVTAVAQIQSLVLELPYAMHVVFFCFVLRDTCILITSDFPSEGVLLEFCVYPFLVFEALLSRFVCVPR